MFVLKYISYVQGMLHITDSSHNRLYEIGDEVSTERQRTLERYRSKRRCFIQFQFWNEEITDREVALQYWGHSCSVGFEVKSAHCTLELLFGGTLKH